MNKISFALGVFNLIGAVAWITLMSISLWFFPFVLICALGACINFVEAFED